MGGGLTPFFFRAFTAGDPTIYLPFFVNYLFIIYSCQYGRRGHSYTIPSSTHDATHTDGTAAIRTPRTKISAQHRHCMPRRSNHECITPELRKTGSFRCEVDAGEVVDVRSRSGHSDVRLQAYTALDATTCDEQTPIHLSTRDRITVGGTQAVARVTAQASHQARDCGESRAG